MKATKLIIALALTAASITSAHAGFATALKCPKAGDVMVRGIGQVVSITEGNKEFPVGQPTMFENVGGKVAIIQGATSETDAGNFRAILFFNNYMQTRKVIYISTARKDNEICRITDYQEWAE